MDDKEKLQKEYDKLKKQFDDAQQKSVQEITDLQKKHVSDITELQKKHREAVEKLTKQLQKDSVVPLSETAAKQQADAALNDAKPQSTLNLGFANATAINGSTTPAYHPNDVKFEVTDPKETGMPKGITVISTESAAHFEKIGIGKIVK